MTEKIDKNYIIVQAQIDGEVALTKADTYNVTSRALERYKAMDIPFIKLVKKKEWNKSPDKKKRTRKTKEEKNVETKEAEKDAMVDQEV